jgi:hypothetical protein
MKMDSSQMQTDVRQNLYCASFDVQSAEPQEFAENYTVMEFNQESWYTPTGSALKKKKLLSKGFPKVKNWRFVTMTLDPELFSDPVQAYEYVTERMRYFFRDLRKVYGNFKYCWKLEFHENGWPHWHALIEIKSKVDLDLWRKLWGNGRIEVQRADSNAQEYLFKYITKSGGLPEWVLHYPRQMRFWQTSRGFYTKEAQTQKERKCLNSLQKNSRNFRTIAQKLENWQKTVLIKSGKWIRKTSIKTNFQKLWNSLVWQRYSDFTLEISFLSHSSFNLSRDFLFLLEPFLAWSYGRDQEHNEKLTI